MIGLYYMDLIHNTKKELQWYISAVIQWYSQFAATNSRKSIPFINIREKSELIISSQDELQDFTMYVYPAIVHRFITHHEHRVGHGTLKDTLWNGLSYTHTLSTCTRHVPHWQISWLLIARHSHINNLKAKMIEWLGFFSLHRVSSPGVYTLNGQTAHRVLLTLTGLLSYRYGACTPRSRSRWGLHATKLTKLSN